MADAGMDCKETMGQLPRASIDAGRKKLGLIALRAASGERVVLMHSRKDMAAVVSMKDLERLLALDAEQAA
jgi:hypothetical protein